MEENILYTWTTDKTLTIFDKPKFNTLKECYADIQASGIKPSDEWYIIKLKDVTFSKQQKDLVKLFGECLNEIANGPEHYEIIGIL